MNLRLCFGTFITLLDLYKYNITQERFIAEVVKIVDPISRYTRDRTASNKLKKCQINFRLDSGYFNDVPSIDSVKESMKNNIIPFIDESKIATLILSLLYIIQNESRNKTLKEEYLKKYFSADPNQLLTEKEFVFSEFLSRILLYTLYSGINNKIGSDCIKFITEDFINEKFSPYIEDCQWISPTETLVLLFREEFILFNEALENYAMRKFIEETDPTNQMNDECLENCENFLDYIRDNIWVPFGQNSIGKMLQMIQNFSQTLDDYTTYLGKNMIPSSSNPSVFIPRHRDENPRWAKNFVKTVYDYRQQLATIYDKACKYMLFESMDQTE